MAVTAGMIAKTAATALSNEKLRKGIGWGLVAVLSPVILLIAALCSIGTGGADHNNQAVAAAFYDEAETVFDAGASHLTHLFNAMPGIHHRKPGPIGAGSERKGVTAELICDGLHVHPSAIRMAFKLFPGRVCLISDALRCCGMPDGKYTLGGQEVFLKNGVARLADGTIAGSATNLYDCMKKAVEFGIPREQAVMSATIIPAAVVGCADKVGSIAAGKNADFVVCDEQLNPKSVYLNGVLLKKTSELSFDS